jgi:septal ring factor EnvC (AmiA/AmiB activator)
MRKAFLCLLLLVLLWPPAADSGQLLGGDSNPRAIKRDLQTLRHQISREERRSRRARQRQASILQEVDALNRNRAILQRELQGLDEEVTEVGRKVAALETEAACLGQNYEVMQEKFCRRLRTRYCQPPGKWLDFLDRDISLGEKINAFYYGQRVLEADRCLQQECGRLLKDVRARREELEKHRHFLLELKQRQAAKVAEMEENIAKKKQLLYKIRHQVKAHDELVSELKKMAGKLELLTQTGALPETDFASRKGDLPMPVEGVVISFFGLEKDSDFATVTSNKGIEIEARPGTPVRVIYPGKVVFASWMKGYGNLLVVDHGGGYVSVYAHLRHLACRVNDYLKSRQVVGEVGIGAFSDVPSLYFEIRRDGIPEDPLTWVSQLQDGAG